METKRSACKLDVEQERFVPAGKNSRSSHSIEIGERAASRGRLAHAEIDTTTRVQLLGCVRHICCSGASCLARSSLTNSRAQRPEQQTFVTKTYSRGNEHEQRRPLLQATAANSNEHDEKEHTASSGRQQKLCPGVQLKPDNTPYLIGRAVTGPEEEGIHEHPHSRRLPLLKKGNRKS